MELEDKIWKRLVESLKETNGQRGLHKLVNNAEMLSAFMEANNVISESSNALLDIKHANKKIDLSTHNRSVDNALVFIILKGLTTIPTKTKAYKYGLIDATGRLIRKPKTKEEHESISNLDLLFFRLRTWLSSRINYLTSISWIKSSMENIRPQNYFSNYETLSRQYVVRKLNDELNKVLKN